MIKEKYINHLNETAITIVNSRVECIGVKNITKTGLRVYKNGYIGIASALGKYDNEKLENKAIDSLDDKIKYTCEISRDKTRIIDKRNNIIDDKEFINEIELLFSELRECQPNFSFSNKIKMIEITTTLSNDSNLYLQHSDKALEVELYFKEKSSKNVIDGEIKYFGRNYDRRLLVYEINMILNAYKNNIKLENKETYPVIFLNSNNIILEKFITDLHGRNFAAGVSLFSDKQGQKMFNEEFTLYQSNNPEDVTNRTFFDAEGVVNKDYKFTLIENGVIKAPYTDKRLAEEYNLPKTGSAMSDYSEIPHTKYNSNLMLEESNKTVKELLGGNIGVLVLMSEGGDFTSDGNFSTPVQLSMLFDGEKLIGRLPQIQLSSNIFDMFGNSFRGVGKDIFPFSKDKLIVMDMKVSEL